MHLLESLETKADTAILSLDIHKAFDSVDWLFLNMVLRSYGFPSYFLNWVDAMHEDVELRVLNNGHLSNPIIAKKGVAQGCSLSPYLFVLVIETLACYIRSSPRIKGFSYKGLEKKVGLVADDCLLFLEASVDNFIELHMVLSHFSAMSGLRINFSKSCLLYFHAGPWLLNPAVSLYSQVSMQEGFTHLGTHLGSNELLASNVPHIFVSMRDLLKSCPVQTTSLSGRILQVKSLAASRFVYLFQLLPTPDKQFFSLLDTEYFNHIWDNGQHKLNKQTMFLPRAEGGFNMLNVYLQEQSLKLSWLNRFLSDSSILSLMQHFLYTCTIIPFTDFLRCNISARYYSRMFRCSVPQIVTDIFNIWFKRCFVNSKLDHKYPDTRHLLLNSLFCFNEVIGGCHVLRLSCPFILGWPTTIFLRLQTCS